METNEIVKLILSDYKELSKSTRFYKLTTDEQVNVIISQRPELKNCCLADVASMSKCCNADCDEPIASPDGVYCEFHRSM